LLLATESQLLATVAAFDDALAVIEELQNEVGVESRMVQNYAQMIKCSRAALTGNVAPFLALAEALPKAANPRLVGSVYSYLARVLLDAGQLEGAGEWAARSLDLPGGSPGPRAAALAVRARLAILRGDVEAALADSAAALGHALSAGIWLGAFIYLARVDALAAAGRSDESRAAAIASADAMRHAARHVGEYREPLFALPDFSALFRKASS
jgi:hypothetical protein